MFRNCVSNVLVIVCQTKDHVLYLWDVLLCLFSYFVWYWYGMFCCVYSHTLCGIDKGCSAVFILILCSILIFFLKISTKADYFFLVLFYPIKQHKQCHYTIFNLGCLYLHFFLKVIMQCVIILIPFVFGWRLLERVLYPNFIINYSA
jgi:hypothetical protein